MQPLNGFFGVLALLPLFILAATPDRVQAQCEAARFVGSDTAARDRFGSSLSVDGDLLVVGAPEANCPEFGCSDAGAAYVFRLDDNATPADPSDDQWMQEAKLVASDAAGYDKLGRSVSVKGTVVLAGASWSDCSTVPNSFCGAAYVYRFNGSDWIEEQKLRAGDPGVEDRFGISVSVDGAVALVGAYYDECYSGVAEACGSAYVIRYNGWMWVQEAKLMASDGAKSDYFGRSVSLTGDTALIGAYGSDAAGPADCGAAYVFRLEGDQWVEVQKLAPSDPRWRGGFGRSVATDADLAVIGAGGGWMSGLTGSAYVFRFDGGEWIEEAKLTPSDGAPEDHFGQSVSISGDRIAVGAPGSDCSTGPDCGAAYLYRFNGSDWIEEVKLTPSSMTDSVDFGEAVALAGGETILVGAPGDDTEGASGTGAAYMFIPEDVGPDCNANGVVDRCDIGVGTSGDCNENQIPDDCELAAGTSEDCNNDLVPDECQPDEDCNANGVRDICDIGRGTSADCNDNLIPDDCIWLETDCNDNSSPDECDIGAGTSWDCNRNLVPDDCEPGTEYEDCNENLVPDECDIAYGTSLDHNENGTPDDCEPCYIASRPQAELIADKVSRKNRYLSVRAGDSGRLEMMRVTALSLPPPFDVWNGQQWYVGQPFQVCENAGQGANVDPAEPPPGGCGPAPGQPQNWFWAAPLMCDMETAHVMDWTTLADYCNGGDLNAHPCIQDSDCPGGECGVDGVVHLYHEGIVPSSMVSGAGPIEAPAIYEIRVCDSTCPPQVDLTYSLPLTLTQAGWGDVALNVATCPREPPDESVGVVTDVIALLGKFANAYCAPKKARADIQPNNVDFKIGIVEVVQCLNAFMGDDYPFSVGTCVDGQCSGGPDHGILCGSDADCGSDPCTLEPPHALR